MYSVVNKYFFCVHCFKLYFSGLRYSCSYAKLLLLLLLMMMMMMMMIMMMMMMMMMMIEFMTTLVSNGCELKINL